MLQEQLTLPEEDLEMLSSPLQPPNSPVSEPPSGTGSPGPSILEDGFLPVALPPLNTIEYSKERIRLLEMELTHAHQRTEENVELINNLQDRVNVLEAMVEKQRVTICNQSKTISDRRTFRNIQSVQHSPMVLVPMTPHQHHPHGIVGHHATTYPHIQSPHPIPNSAPGVAGAGLPASPFGASRPTRSQSVFDQPPPRFELSVSAPSQNEYLPANRNDNQTTRGDTRDIFTSMPVSSGPRPAGFSAAIAAFSKKFQDLMRRSELFAQMHASFPNIYLDSHLDEKAKEYIMAISSRTQASLLLGNPSTRFLLVAKAVNYYLIQEIMKPTVVKGFDIAVDLEIGQITKQMGPDTPPIVRHLMILAIATHLTNLSKKPGFAEFCQQKIQSHITKLWQFIGPLSHGSTTHSGQAWGDLASIISEAQALAVEMHILPLEYKLDFPELSEQFDPSTMINRDPYVLGDPQTLKIHDTRVRLGITPIVRIRDNSETPRDVKLMYLGHVLLKHVRRQDI